MNETVQMTNSKAKAKPIAGSTALPFEFAKFAMPNFEMPKIEFPSGFREFSEKSASQAKETYQQMKASAEEATAMLEDTFTTASKSASDYGLKVIEATRVNTNAAFDFCTELMTVKSFSELVELSTAHARKQFEAVTAQTQEFAALTQKVATETSEPIKESLTKAFKKAA